MVTGCRLQITGSWQQLITTEKKSMELELITLYGTHLLGIAIFGKFEVESPWWRWMLKWAIMMSLTYGFYYFFGHVGSMTFLIAALALSLTVHFWWCKRHGIDPIRATPRKKYYELRAWTWKE